jgi:uncharacterized protein YecT (DUF1311 family)
VTQLVRISAGTALELVLCALVLTFPAAAGECDSAKTSYDLDVCYGAVARKAEESLDAEYRRYLAKLDAKEKDLLDKAQAAWKIYREAQCRAVEGTADGGSLAGMQYSACKKATADARLEELKATYEGP